MNLRSYLKHGQCSQLANICGVSTAMIRQISCGSRQPSLELALRISHATNGEVTIFELAPAAFTAPDGVLSHARLFPTDPTPGVLDTVERMLAVNDAQRPAKRPAKRPRVTQTTPPASTGVTPQEAAR